MNLWRLCGNQRAVVAIYSVLQPEHEYTEMVRLKEKLNGIFEIVFYKLLRTVKFNYC